MNDQKPITEGERRVRLSFNPGSNPYVNEVKKKAAELIDVILWAGKDKRCTELAITDIEEGAMWAVKSITANSL